MPGGRFAFHRYAWISNYGEDAPEGASAVIAEITVPPGCAVDLERLKAEVMRGLAELEGFKEAEVEVAEAWLRKYGRPA